MTPRVSVALVAFNRAEQLRTTIETILAQTYDDFELVVSDDCSTDGTEDVCRALAATDRRIVYRRNPVNLGMPGNLNAAIAATSGELIANLHDGDVYEPTLLERWVAAMDACPDAAFVFNAYRWLRPDGTTARIYRVDMPACAPGTVLLERVFFRRWRFNSPVWGTVMARRSAYEQAGPFDPAFGIVADVAMWMRLAEDHHVAYVDEPLITLPSRFTVPQRFTSRQHAEARRALERIFWDARKRRFASRPVRLAGEAVLHAALVPVSRTAYAGHDLGNDLRVALRRRISGGRPAA
jgi:glycosyltransferase involved in cell wall biosynthesis